MGSEYRGARRGASEFASGPGANPGMESSEQDGVGSTVCAGNSTTRGTGFGRLLPGNAEESRVGGHASEENRPPFIQTAEIGAGIPSYAQTGLLPAAIGGQQLVQSSHLREDAVGTGQETPEGGQSKGSSPTVELSPYLRGTRGHTTPVGRATSARRRLTFDFEEQSPIYTSAFKRPRLAERQAPSASSVSSKQFASTDRREQSTPMELPRRGSHPERERGPSRRAG